MSGLAVSDSRLWPVLVDGLGGGAMISAAYLVLVICGNTCEAGHLARAVTQIPQTSMDQCILQANAFNKNLKDIRALCVKGSDK